MRASYSKRQEIGHIYILVLSLSFSFIFIPSRPYILKQRKQKTCRRVCIRRCPADKSGEGWVEWRSDADRLTVLPTSRFLHLILTAHICDYFNEDESYIDERVALVCLMFFLATKKRALDERHRRGQGGCSVVERSLVSQRLYHSLPWRVLRKR